MASERCGEIARAVSLCFEWEGRMNRFGMFVVAVFAAVVVVIASGGALTHAASPAGSGPDTACSSSSPCLTENNNDGGLAIKAASAQRSGLVGRTDAKGY